MRDLATTFGTAATLASLLAIAACSAPSEREVDRDPRATDALHRRISSELEGFVEWLRRNDARGYIGEVGWPGNRADADQWNALADDWLSAADDAGLWVTGWATGEWWPTDYVLLMYSRGGSGRSVDTPGTQSGVFEAHVGQGSAKRGVTVAGAEFGAPINKDYASFSNRSPGKYDRDYHYESIGTFRYLASRGIELVRLPFRWERIQPELGGALDADEVERMRAAVSRASSAGLDVLLDMHNYGAYYLWNGERGDRCPIGSDDCPIASFVDVWERISAEFEDEDGVIAYGLMCEPVGLQATGDLSQAEVWRSASQQALSAIRQRGDDKLIMVAGYNWSSVPDWTKWNPEPWIDDPADRFLYEGHHYWDGDQSGNYVRSYSDEVKASRTTSS